MDEQFGTISLDEGPPLFGNVSLNEPNQVAAVPPEVAQPRAAKAHFGLGDQSPGFDTLYNGIANGEEGRLRLDIAKQYDSYLRLKKMSAISDIAQQGATGNVEHAQALMAWDPNTSPESIFEKSYAQQYVTHIADNESSTTREAMDTSTEGSHAVLDHAQDIITNQEMGRKIEEEAHTFSTGRFFSPGLPMIPGGGLGLDYIKSGLPFLNAAQNRNIFEATASILPGNNLDEQITYLWGLPPEEFASKFRGAVKQLQAINPLNAAEFARAVNNFSEQGRVNLNVGAMLDATIIGGPLAKLTKLMKGAVTGNAAKKPNVGNALEAVGDIPKAADVKAAEQVTARMQPEVMPVVDRGFDPLGQKLDLTSVLPSWANPNTLMTPGNVGSLSRQRAAQIADVLVAENKAVENTMSKVTRVSRTTGPDLQVGLARTKEKLEEQYTHLQDNILDQRNVGIPGFEHLRAEDTRTNVDYVLMNVGKPAAVIPEKVNEAAVRIERQIYKGVTHPDAIEEALDKLGIKTHNQLFKDYAGKIEEGFLTTKGRYVDRKEALTIANKEKQISSALSKEERSALREEGLDSQVFSTPSAEVILGKEGSTLFKTAGQADNYAQNLYQLHHKEYRTMQGPGNSWYISIVKPVDETDLALRSLELETRNKNSDSWVNSWAGYYLTPAGQVSPFIRDQRLIATSASTEIHKLAKRLAEPIKGTYLGTPGLSKYQSERLNDVLEYYRDYVDYSKPQSRGMFPTSMAALEKDWKKVTGKLPTGREQEAFWSAVKINDMDWMLRNYNTHRDLARQGVEHIAIPHPNEPGTYTSPFMGKVLGPSDMDRFWNNPEDAVISIYRKGEYEHTTKHGNRMVGDEELRDWIKQPNTKIVQIANPDDRPLKGVLDHNPHFIISEDIQRSELPIKLVDYNGGGHVIYPGKWYVKQPIVEQGLLGKHYHYGDQTIFNFNSSVQAKHYSEKMDEFRLMLKAGRTDAELDSFVQKNLPKDLEFWKNKFIGDSAILSLDHPIMFTERNSTTFQTNPKLKEMYKARLGGEDVISYPESSYNLMAGVDKTFMMERDGPLMTIESSVYNKHTPVYSLVPAKTMKPLQAMDQGIQSAIRGLYMNDVKTATIEQFIKQYAPYFNENFPIDKVHRNPYYAFYHGELVKPTAENRQTLNNIENTRRNLKNFLRTGSDLQGELDVAEEKFLQKLFNQTDDKTINWYADRDLYMIKHPVDFMSKAVSSMKFGFYNVLQAVVQTMGAIQAMSFHPIHGFSGAAGALLSYWGVIAEGTLSADISKGVLQFLDRSATKYGGWKKGWFSESQTGMNSMGWFNIGKEVSVRDSLQEQSLFTSKLGTFHDKGYMPFNFGERNSRLVSWHMAFHEWKTNNPGLSPDSRGLGEILNRANQYNSDMIRESNSAFQQGVVGSIPTKFQSFRQRLAEQYLGDRWTAREKANSLAFNSMVWGVPVAAGAALGVENFYEDVRKYAIDNGITLNNKYIEWLHEGILDQIVEAATGTSYSISKRLGPGPDNSLRNLLPIIGDPEKFMETALGAMGSGLESMGRAMYPLYAGVYTAIRGGQDQYTITHDEIIDVARELSTVNNLHNAYYAWNYQRYISRNKQVVVDPSVSSTGLAPMSKTDAVMMLLLGATRKDISDVRLGQDVYKHQQDSENALGKRAVEELRKAYQALGEEDFAKADKYLVNSKVLLTVLGDTSEAKQLQIQKQALAEVGTTVADRVNQLLYDPSRIPASKIPARLMKHFNIDTRRSPFGTVQ